MSLKAATDPIQDVCDLYAERCGIARDDDWYLLKIQEELGELVQAHPEAHRSGPHPGARAAPNWNRPAPTRRRTSSARYCSTAAISASTRIKPFSTSG